MQIPLFESPMLTITSLDRKGSAIFWINLHRNGTGDERVMHAGLPLKGGRKTAMNIWPRQFVQMK
jgi:prolyl 4-hydroxylase